MKIITIIGLLVSLNVFSQEMKISDLENLKQNLTAEINKLNDSLKKVDIQIAFLKSSEIKKMVSDSSLTSYAREKAYIKKSPNVMGEIITKLTEKKQVVLLDYYDGYFGICTDSICGYMSEMWIEKNKKIYEFIKVKKEEQKELKRLEYENKLKLKQAEYAKLEKEYIKKYGQKTYDKLMQGYYWIGMNREMATISLGRPKDINRTVGSWGVHEQWVYDGIYLYFENGKLTSYQN
ncbi:hypothetical protein D778_01533 [Xanthomarina gelatinilytica]|uniref:Uncharacterized protein n=1 Tax=Xanthomarina gelatinilytica TaxID=1137281 RepID=M7MCA3_9FLAO|nr:hypothetical protein [Xanthomarina gelatinilytica]EMQ93772.1 hypothetical protein D778_01533 [Xanthomarina gelatinilytica]